MMHALRHPIQFRRDHRFTGEHASDYLDGVLSPSANARIDQHASVCPKCGEFLRSLRATLTGLRVLRQSPEHATPDSSITAGVLDALKAEDHRQGRRSDDP